MKQRRFGQKIQNWHRPLGPDDLRARYLRQRDTPAGIVTVGGISQEPPEFDYDDYDDRSYWDCEGPDSPILHNSNLVWSICHPNQPLSSLWKLFPQEAPLPPLVHCPADELIYQLAEYVERITQYKSDDPELTETINSAIGCNRARELVHQHLPKSAEAICLFAPFWYRSPLTWNPESGQSLEEHLFLLYPVPSCLLPTTRSLAGFQNYKWLCWLILLGRSISLKKAASVFDWNILGKLPHYIQQANVSVRSAVEGVVYAEVLRLGGTEQDFRRVIADDSYRIDITDSSLSEEDLRFWRESVQWLIAHRDELTDTGCEQILAWARHCYTETRRQGDVFRWVGRTVPAACAQAEAYAEEQQAWLTSGRYQFYWKPQGWDWTAENGWSITELTSTQQLAEEGAAMRHCVGGYGWQCRRGVSAIFSVRYQDERQVTVEIFPQTKTIRQIHGFYNRNATAEEQAIVTQWRRTIVASSKENSPPNTLSGGEFSTT